MNNKRGNSLKVSTLMLNGKPTLPNNVCVKNHLHKNRPSTLNTHLYIEKGLGRYIDYYRLQGLTGRSVNMFTEHPEALALGRASLSYCNPRAKARRQCCHWSGRAEWLVHNQLSQPHRINQNTLVTEPRRKVLLLTLTATG